MEAERVGGTRDIFRGFAAAARISPAHDCGKKTKAFRRPSFRMPPENRRPLNASSFPTRDTNGKSGYMPETRIAP